MVDVPPRRLVVLTAPEAEASSAYDWYEAQSVGLGAEFLRAVDAVLASIRRTPALYPAVRGRTRRALLRRFPYGVCFYEREEAREVVVVAVVHGRRHPRVWRSRTAG